MFTYLQPGLRLPVKDRFRKTSACRFRYHWAFRFKTSGGIREPGPWHHRLAACAIRCAALCLKRQHPACERHGVCRSLLKKELDDYKAIDAARRNAYPGKQLAREIGLYRKCWHSFRYDLRHFSPLMTAACTERRRHGGGSIPRICKQTVPGDVVASDTCFPRSLARPLRRVVTGEARCG